MSPPASKPVYKVTARNAAFGRVAQIDDYTSLRFTLRFNIVSSWELTVPASRAALFGPGTGIIVERAGFTDPIISGPVGQPVRQRDKNKNQLVASGSDDTVFLADRLAYPVPAGPPYTASDYDVRTGIAETIMREYVDVNLGPSASSNRRLPGFTLAVDGARGGSVTGRARFQNLLDLISQLALAGGDLGFRIVQVGAGLQFQVYDPVDRTTTAKFSFELGNLAEFNYTAKAPEANYVIVGGSGEGSARTFVEGSDSTSIARWGRRIETFRDRRDTGSGGELEQSILEELEQRGERTDVKLAPLNTGSVQFGRDYGLGDQVTAIVDGVPISNVIREVAVTYEPPSGETITPSLGTPGPRSVLDVFEAVRRNDRRLSTLERR